MKKNIFQSSLVQMIWKSIRKRRILAQHKRVAKDINILIDEYLSDQKGVCKLNAKMQLENSKIIWQYWGQGIEDNNLPEVVNLCFKSVERHKGEYTIIRLDDVTIREYVDLPDFIWNKLYEGIITRTLFSDVLRLALLYCYGGVWLDATIFLSGPLEQRYIDKDYFMFQRCQTSPYKSIWENSYAYYWGWDRNFKVTVLSSIIYAKKGNDVIYDLYMLLLLSLEKFDKILDYFVLHIIYYEYMNNYRQDSICEIVDDTYPHILQTLFNNNATDIYSFEDALAYTSTHKMSYFGEVGLKNFKSFVNSRKFK